MLARLGPPAARLLARSWRLSVLRAERWRAVEASRRPYVLVSWHEALLPVMWHHRGRGIAALISQARDGEHLAGFAASLGYGLIRGSSSRDGRRALVEAIRALRAGVPVGITPDGPRGPPRVAKAGAFLAATRTRALVVPVHADARWAWRARSWDRFLLPGPGAGVRLAYGTVVDAAATDPAEIEARATAGLEEALRLATCPDGAVTPTG